MNEGEPMKTKEIIKRGRKTASKGSAEHGCDSLGRVSRQTVRPGRVGGAPDLSSDGRSWKGWRHRARHVRSASAGLPGLFVQISLERGSGPRLSLALHEMPAESRAHWNF